MPKIIVLYHRADFDGLYCREIAKKYFTEKGDDFGLIGWDYGDSAPVISDDVEWIYMLDISIDSLMNDPRLIWIDHHKSAIDKYRYIRGLQVDGVAACRLAWQYFYDCPGSINIYGKQYYVDHLVQEPLAVRLAGEFDTWDKRDPRVDLFQYGMKSCNMDEWWHELLNYGNYAASEVGEIIDRGVVVKQYAKNQDTETLKNFAFDLYWEGLAFLALNTAKCNSLTFESKVQDYHDATMGFRYDGSKWTVSMYGVPGKPDIDLSYIAVKYGGGGHRRACGFQCKELPFLVGGD